MSESSYLPGWLEALLGEKFFNACIIHEDAKKNEKNIFCLDCCEGICSHCLPLHSSHRLLQIRRYVYYDVIWLLDAEKLMDCSHVQPYTSNSAKVVFLNQRPLARAMRGASSACLTCDRALRDPYLFCSLSCKIQHIQSSEGTVTEHLYDCEIMTLRELGLDDGQMTPDSVLEPAGSLRTSSGSSGNNLGGGADNSRMMTCTATTEVVRKKRSNLSAHRLASRSICSPVLEISAGRRKGTPHRAPLI